MTDLPYRLGVNAIIVDSENKFLLVQKQSYAENQWEFAGGGLEENEDPKDGILRELKEELGSSDFTIIKLSPLKIKFEWPIEAQKHGFEKHGIWWRGQEKYQFIVKFNGDKNSLVLQKDEIIKIKWVSYEELKEHLIFKDQFENAVKVITEAKLNF